METSASVCLDPALHVFGFHGDSCDCSARWKIPDPSLKPAGSFRNLKNGPLSHFNTSVSQDVETPEPGSAALVLTFLELPELSNR